MLRDDDASWRSPKVLVVLALIFVCGIAVGAAVTRSLLHSRIEHARQQSLNLGQLSKSLNLTPDQERIVTKELDDYAKYYQNIEEQRTDVAEHGKRRILDVLTPEQQKKFDQLFSQLPH